MNEFIKHAEISDISGIISVLESNLMAHKKIVNPDVLEKTGFLLHGFTADDANAAICDKENFIFLISSANNEVTGYIKGCDIKKLNQPFKDALAQVSAQMKEIVLSEKTIYLRHIAKNTAKKHVGKNLLEAFIDQAKKSGYQNIVCIIAEKPIQNKISIAFHEKFGFGFVGYKQDEDKEYRVYWKKL